MADAIDISDLPAPPQADISDLPVPPQATATRGPDTLGETLSYAGRQLGGVGEAGINLLQSLYAQPAAALSREVARAIPGADPDKVHDAVIKHLVSQWNPDNAALQTVSGAVSLPARAVGATADYGISKLPASAQPWAQQVKGAGADLLALAPVAPIANAGADAIRTSIEQSDATQAAQEQARANLNAPRDAILAQARTRGLVVPPTAVNPSAEATAAESISGKAATRQAMQATNSDGFNSIIRDDLGLPKDQPLTRDALHEDIKTAGKIYGQVEKAQPIIHDDAYTADLDRIQQLGPDLESAYPGSGAQANDKVTALVDSLRQPQVDAKDAIGMFKFLNNSAKDNFQAGFAGDPQALQLARGQRAGADALSDLIQRNLEASGNKALADDWQDARIQIAKGYTALGALKGNNIDAMNLAAQMRKDKPLSGGFKLVADFADQFPEVSTVPKSGAGVSKLAAVVGGAGVAGAAEALALGHPVAAAVAGTAAGVGAGLPYALRQYLLSDSGQARLGTPAYDQRLLDLARKYAPGPRAAAEPDAFSLAPDEPLLSGPRANNADYAAVLSQGVGEHQGAPELTASTPTAMTARPSTRPANFSPAMADYMSRGLSLAPDSAATVSLHEPSDFARVLASLVPEGTMARTPHAFQPDYGLTLDRLAQQYTPSGAPSLPGTGLGAVKQSAAIRQALKDQAGYARGGYHSELAILRRSVQNR